MRVAGDEITIRLDVGRILLDREKQLQHGLVEPLSKEMRAAYYPMEARGLRRIEMADSGRNPLGSSSVPTRIVTKCGRAETRRNTVEPQSGQKARVIVFPLSAVLA